MADRIITVTDPSVVTNDTLASYNNYTNQPSADTLLGSMTIGEASAGKTVALTDGLVHEVTTKPVGTTNGEFTAVVSNAVTVDLSAPVEQWDISLATYDGISTNVVAQLGTSVATISVNALKTKLFLTSNTNKAIYQYTINGDGTLTYDGISLDLSGASATILSGGTMSNDGRYFLVALQQDNFLIFDIAIGDAHTIENVSATPSHTVTALGDNVNTIMLSDDDLIVYLGRSSGATRAADIDLAAGTIVDRTDSFTIPSVTTYSTFLGDSGNKLYCADQDSDSIKQFDLVTPYTMAGAVQGTPLDLSSWTAGLRGAWTDGIKMYAVETTTGDLRRYSM